MTCCGWFCLRILVTLRCVSDSLVTIKKSSNDRKVVAIFQSGWWLWDRSDSFIFRHPSVRGWRKRWPERHMMGAESIVGNHVVDLMWRKLEMIRMFPVHPVPQSHMLETLWWKTGILPSPAPGHVGFCVSWNRPWVAMSIIAICCP